MAAKILVGGEDFIDMEVSSYSNAIFCHSQSQPREFEFQMSSTYVEERSEAIASPADELFYKGKLLPLHLPPRLQMVEKLLQNSPFPDFDHKNQTFHNEFDQDEFFSTPLATTTKPTPTTTTCNTPFESCQVSRELNPEEYIFEFGDDDHDHDHIGDEKMHQYQNKKSWTKKLMKKPSLGSTIKASRAYLRSLFGKSGACSCETYYAVSTKVADESSASKGLNKNAKSGKKVPFGQIQRTNNKEKRTSSEDGNGNGTGNSNNRHRRSFSVGLKLMQSGNNKSSSSSSSSFLAPNKSSATHQNLKRCCSTNSERENSIQGAIAHCKKSSQISISDNNGGTTSLCSFSAQQIPAICRG
ncbi:probable membrane-associated kinase regulator 4 [Neltuma alba]|uniref:probable membrane-associated kinase regulator 4 n=1 Tax=Neltuma alba TaxID=207710 RepID=UPI0010A31389|nr:probable membrane-associated kinase regulator 4 [Prosopis alba]